ncbi:MAG TPA: hypothetical protein VMF06_21060, partial [Candidatus Limnocylindria bacterium]|nr:hypothetical protein [Candidatus Limnocylindria bacterium]
APKRWQKGVSVLLCLLVLLLSYCGLKLFTVSYSSTTGNSTWHIDSWWFFLVSLIFALVSLGLVAWRWLSKEAGPRL